MRILLLAASTALFITPAIAGEKRAKASAATTADACEAAAENDQKKVAAAAVEREMKESGEKGGTEDINIGVGELQECTSAEAEPATAVAAPARARKDD